jgi:ABC-type transport system involved in cytochrome bd biosynthesis fused ATPase/permease subunit
MTTTTKAVAWVGAIFGTVSVAVLALIIGTMMYTGYKNSERQRQQQEASTQLNQDLVQDLQDLSKMEIKPMTEGDYKKWTSGASSPTATPQK